MMIYTVTQQKKVLYYQMGEIGEGSMWRGKGSCNRDKLQFAIVESQSWTTKNVKKQ